MFHNKNILKNILKDNIQNNILEILEILEIKNQIKNQIKNSKLFVYYILFAGTAALVDIILLYTLTEFLYVWYIYSAAISYTMGMIVNYSLNKYLNFKNKSKYITHQFGIFFIVAFIGLGLNQFIIYSLVEYLKLEYMISKLICLSIVVFWSFFGHKKFTFRM